MSDFDVRCDICGLFGTARCETHGQIDVVFAEMRAEGDNFRYTQHNNSDGVVIFVRGEEELRKLQEGTARIQWCPASPEIPEGLVLVLDYAK